MAHFSPSCVHHSQANAHKVYEQPATLFDHIHGAGPEPEARSGYASSERSRVTMSCVIRYADAHRPDLMIVENVVEAAKWGPNRNGDDVPLVARPARQPRLPHPAVDAQLGRVRRPADARPHVRHLLAQDDAHPRPRAPRRRLVPALRHRRRGPPGVPAPHQRLAARRVGQARHPVRLPLHDAATTSPTSPTRRRRPSSTGPTSAPASATATSPSPPTPSPASGAASTPTAAASRTSPTTSRPAPRSPHRSARSPPPRPTPSSPASRSSPPATPSNATARHAATRTLNEPTWTQHTTASVGDRHPPRHRSSRSASTPYPPALDEPTCTQTAQQRPGLALWRAGRGDVRQEQRRPRRHRLPRHQRPVRHHHHARHHLARLDRPRPARRPRRRPLPHAHTVEIARA